MADPDHRLQDFLIAGVAPDDIVALFPLLRGRELLRAFTALFHGGEDAVMVRLLVLRTLGARPQAPDWSAAEIREHLGYLEPAKLETVVGRLKEHQLLGWDAELQRYRISPLGRKALAAVEALLQFEQDDADGLGYITAQLAAGQAVGRVSAEELGHLLSRLTELKDDFDRAVLSGSEHRIRSAAATLDQTWRWIDKGTEIIRAITEDPQIDAATHRLAQAVGRAQSGLLRQTGVFQRALNQIDQHRVHLGSSGLSSSDLVAWLRGQGPARLASFADEIACAPLPSRWLHDGIALDVAEYELVDRERIAHEQASLPQASAAPETHEVETEQEDLGPLGEWRDELTALLQTIELHALVPQARYADSAYRLSLLSLLGDRESAALDGPAADIARLPLQLEIGTELLLIDDHDEIAAISDGRLRPIDKAPAGAASTANATSGHAAPEKIAAETAPTAVTDADD